MESTRKHLSERGAHTARRQGDIQRLKNDGTASVAELREFLGQMHGKSPQEVMGAMAESSLVRSLVIATAGFAVVLVVFTIGPYALARMGGPEKQETQKAPSAAQTAAAAAPVPQQQTATQPQAAAPAGQTGLPPGTDGQKVIDALDIGETKQAAPDSNPLDKQLDGLLEGVD